ncbi:MAG: hypothetical protein NVSMB3_04370 [Acidobacteriaceae bacterium]
MRKKIFLACCLLYVSAAAQSVPGDAKSRLSPVQAGEALVKQPRYVLNAQDTLGLSFPITPEFNEVVLVQPDGFITLLGAASIKVRGLTVAEAEQSVRQAYAGLLRDPSVSIDLKDYQRPMFTTLGQVSKPGQYELRRETTVAEALAMSGGLAATSRTQVLLYRKVGDNRYTVQSYNLRALLDGRINGEQPRLAAGDMIFVPEKAVVNFRKYVPYGLGFSVTPLSGFY